MRVTKILAAIIVSLFFMAFNLANYRVQTVRFEKHTALIQFTKISVYGPSLCAGIDTNCTYITVWADWANVPQALPLNASPGNPIGLISIHGDGNRRQYIDGDGDD